MVVGGETKTRDLYRMGSDDADGHFRVSAPSIPSSEESGSCRELFLKDGKVLV